MMKGIYIHFPFCLSKCSYCNFCSIADLDKIKGYIDELIKEINDFSGDNELINTLYIGGGTPGLLEKHYLQRILDAISSKFRIDKNIEFTIEINPCMTENLEDFVSLGVNRVSIGIQSLSARSLKILGRRHTANEALKALRKASKLVDNVSADLIIGTAVTNIEREILTIAPYVKHFSVYMLKLEEGTPLFERFTKSFFPPDDDTVADIYSRAYSALTERGFNRYEISNFALKGYESKHNLKYWAMEDYIGFGCSAHSFYKGRRYFNIDVIDDYISGMHSGNGKEIEEEVDYIFEYIMLGLRTKFGADLRKLYSATGYNFLKVKEKEIKELASFLDLNGESLRIKDEYLLMENHILSKLL